MDCYHTIIGKGFLQIVCSAFTHHNGKTFFYFFLSVSRCITYYLTTIDNDFMAAFAPSTPMKQKCFQVYGSAKFASSLEPENLSKDSGVYK